LRKTHQFADSLTELRPHWMLYLLAALFLLRFLYVAHA